MGSAEKRDPLAAFDWFFEAACPASLEEEPQILRQFPPDFREQEAMQLVPKFCFPFNVERELPSSAVQHFTFTLTDLAGNRRFGFCRLRAGGRSCLCVLSHLPWFEVFYKILNTVAELLAQDQVSEAEDVLVGLQQHPEPGTGISGSLTMLPCFVAPDADRLPSIPENRNLTELVVAVTHENIVGLFAALLAERRVLLISSKLSTLTSCVHAICALLYPMCWEHVLIPTLPPHLLDYCCAPMPFLIGVHSSLAERVRDKALEDVVMMNVDTNTLESPFEDVQALPPDVVSLLKLRLRKVALSSGEGVSRLFLKVQALLFGGYRDALVYTPGQPVRFNEEAFLAQRPGAPLQAFHQRAVHLQLFKQFIEARLEKLNAGEGFYDLFEQEITHCGASLGTLRSYQLWTDNLKKGGGALLNSVKAKTQPAVRNMCRSAKSGLKGVQYLLMAKDGDSVLQRGGSLRTPSLASRCDRLQQRLPITHHFGQNRPVRPSKRTTPQEGPLEPPGKRSPPLSPQDSEGLWAEDSPDGKSFLGDLDLLSEILGTLGVDPQHAGRLRPSHSLDSCRPQRGDLDGCFSLPDIPTSPWQLGEEEEEGVLHPQPQSLPADLSQKDTPLLDNLTFSQNPCSQQLPEACQEIDFLIPSSTAPTDSGGEGDPESSPPNQWGPSTPGCLGTPTVPTQPNHPQSPQPRAPNSETDCTHPSVDSSSHPKKQSAQVLLDDRNPELIREPIVLTSRKSPTVPAREPQAGRIRVAHLKKCFEI